MIRKMIFWNMNNKVKVTTEILFNFYLYYIRMSMVEINIKFKQANEKSHDNVIILGIE